MKALQRTLTILASLFLVVQTARHAYVLWLEPRSSVLDKYDQPLKEEIAAATSIDELLRRYEPVRMEADRIKAERRAADPKAHFDGDQAVEPFKSESTLRQAITSWEERAKEIHATRFYWALGLILAGVGLAAYLRGHRWLGVTLLVVAFSEMIYWTCPSLLPGPTMEFDRLLVNKLVLSIVSLAMLALAVRRLRVFDEERRSPA